jgi:prephenate dehydrogenase
MGVIGLGAFGQLLVERLRPWFQISASDPSPEACRIAKSLDVPLVALSELAACEIIVLAVPVLQIGPVVTALAPLLRPGTTILDVASVKLGPIGQMQTGLPPFVRIIGTHPLFGPQSVKTGSKGLKIAICPVQNVGPTRIRTMLAFLRDRLELDAFVTTPDAHDRDMAMVQGLTHLVAKVLAQMEPLPERQTTLSFDYLVQSLDLVRGDSDELFRAIERENPYSSQVREQFFHLIDQLRDELER